MVFAMRALPLLLLTGLADCSPAHVKAFERGDYVRAAELLSEKVPATDEAERARQDLYRGLTYAALGDLERARFFLSEVQARPALLGREDQARLRLFFEGSGPGPTARQIPDVRAP